MKIKEFKNIALLDLEKSLENSLKRENTLEEISFRMCLNFAKEYIEELYNELKGE